MNNYRLVVCYDGGRYRGWQRQGNTGDTVQGKLEALLSRLLGDDVELAGSGRTDAGVHARRQVCSFSAETDMDPDALLRQIRSHLPEDIGAVSLELAPPRFHARLSCREKSYLYRVWNSAAPNVFMRRYMLAWPDALDIPAMESAAALLCGARDFSAFCGNRHMKKSAVRTLKSVDISRDGDELDIMLTGDGFLQNMVRIIVGTLLEVGSGKRPAGDMPDILASLDRSRAGATAPAHGLTLWDVRY